MKITKSPIRLYASPKAVITQFLNLPGTGRVSNIIRRVKDLPAKTVATCLEKTMQDFASRHRDIQSTFRHHFNKVEVHYKDLVHLFSAEQQLLLGSYLTKEYSIQAAALFNPSIVPHPQQKGLQPGQQRFVMSLRATGEGHISSIVFQTGIAAENGDILLDPPSTKPQKIYKQKMQYWPFMKFWIQIMSCDPHLIYHSMKGSFFPMRKPRAWAWKIYAL
jgi:hypothetical protein